MQTTAPEHTHSSFTERPVGGDTIPERRTFTAIMSRLWKEQDWEVAGDVIVARGDDEWYGDIEEDIDDYPHRRFEIAVPSCQVVIKLCPIEKENRTRRTWSAFAFISRPFEDDLIMTVAKNLGYNGVGWNIFDHPGIPKGHPLHSFRSEFDTVDILPKNKDVRRPYTGMSDSELDHYLNVFLDRLSSEGWFWVGAGLERAWMRVELATLKDKDGNYRPVRNYPVWRTAGMES